MKRSDRREFLGEVGQGMVACLVGPALAYEMGLASRAVADDSKLPALDRLASLIQQTTPDKLLGVVQDQINKGTPLRTLVAGAALANVHAFAGQDYDGYHTFMALAPAFAIAEELPEKERPLPIFKVLYRNASLITGGNRCKTDILGEHEHLTLNKDETPAARLLRAAQERKVKEADGIYMAMTEKKSAEDAFEDVQPLVQDVLNVHNTVLAWRSWEILDFVGKDRARTLLRQSVRHRADYQNHGVGRDYTGVRTGLPKLFEKYGLAGKTPGTREGDKAFVEKLAKVIYKGSRADAGGAVAEALSEGYSPNTICEAMALASTMLVLGDKGRTTAWPGKPIKSVHGDSVGVHASDAANAWRRIAGVTKPRTTFASLIAAAFHTSGQAGGQMPQLWPLSEEVEKVSAKDEATLLGALDEAVRGNDQARACAIVTKYGEQGHDAKKVFAVLRKYAVSEDGALHAEKYYRTASDEFGRSRKEFRWMHLTALARVTASAYGKAAPGLEDARKAFKV